MLKPRLIATLIVKNRWVVQSIGFSQYLPVGKPEIAVEFLNKWGIDEIILLDIDATARGKPDLELIKSVSAKCFVPLTVGGGISSIDHMKEVIRNGADKFSLNTAALADPTLITKASEIFGNQCVVISIDVSKNNQYTIMEEHGSVATDTDLISYVKEVEQLGAGEILLNSVDRDGKKTGYDLDLLTTVSSQVRIPIIACGGVGHAEHFAQGFNSGLVACAAGNYFHFTQHSPATTKAYLRSKNIDARIDTQATYEGFNFDSDGRVAKRDDKYLHSTRFEYEHEEKI